jgi:hypothetical protein
MLLLLILFMADPMPKKFPGNAGAGDLPLYCPEGFRGGGLRVDEFTVT